MVLEELLMNAYRESSWPILNHMERSALDPTHLQVPSRYRDRCPYLYAWAHRPDRTAIDYMVHYDKEGFRVNLDVHQFAPDEIKVKLVDNFLVVDAHHEERPDHHGGISRQFTRRYKLPQDINTQAIRSLLSSDGVLTLYAPKVDNVQDGERTIPIQMTHSPLLPVGPKKDLADKMKELSPQ